MRPNLDLLKTEIPDYIRSRKLLLFPAFSRVLDQTPMVFWNTTKNPEYKEFVAAAEAAGAKVIAFYDREFSAEVVDDGLDRLEQAQLPREEQRAYDRRLRDMRAYDGFTCAVELSFDMNGVVYMFELRTEWFEELNQILDDVESVIPDDEDDDEGPIGGYFSKN